METGNKYFYFVPEIYWKLSLLSYQNYKGNWKQIPLFRTKTTSETGNKYFYFVPELHWKPEKILLFRTKTTL